MKITKVCTQGRQDAGQWVTSFYLSSSVDNVHWSIYRFRSGNKVRNIPCRYFIIRKKNIFQNTSFKERFFLSVFITVTKQKMVKNGVVNNRIAEHHLRTKHWIDWDSSTCITYSTDYYQRLTLESWFTNLEQTPLNRPHLLSAQYKRFIGGIKWH